MWVGLLGWWLHSKVWDWELWRTYIKMKRVCELDSSCSSSSSYYYYYSIFVSFSCNVRLNYLILSTNPRMCVLTDHKCVLVWGSRSYSVVLRSNYCNMTDDSGVTVICRTHCAQALAREFKWNSVVHSVQQKSSCLIFRTSRSGSDVPYSCHHNSSRFTFPIFVHSWRFSLFHSLQSITPRIY
jgi:hypothetical protein